ncbi:SpoIIAA family protein [Shewanella sedimentimangrovi]|uniref:STAS/SEC14 domain-containing protein n=1 Tax=Shewanella sedimentimangrovi TaxID=2814293 RepID=A0ABX7R4G7_9GAMM|nr:STAS/SEC14 domain-containing protein [Shewanella sedimentimangrovi]QSX38729.1 STAS/SEC14 domain-containing protein [Shewanella sedimentimangrovi]
MFSILEENASEVLTVIVSDRVTGEDFEQVLLPAIDAKLKDHASIELLFDIEDSCQGFSLTSVWMDALLALFHAGDVSRVAILVDRPGLKLLAQAQALFMPWPVAIYPRHRKGDARKWLGLTAA